MPSKKKTKKKSKGGRPSADVDWKQLDALLANDATLIDCSEILKLSEKTIQNKIKEKFNCDFSSFKQKKLATTRLNLKQKAIKMGLEGNERMLKYSLNNLTEWRDKKEISTDEDTKKVIRLAYSLPGAA